MGIIEKRIYKDGMWLFDRRLQVERMAEDLNASLIEAHYDFKEINADKIYTALKRAVEMIIETNKDMTIWKIEKNYMVSPTESGKPAKAHFLVEIKNEEVYKLDNKDLEKIVVGVVETSQKEYTNSYYGYETRVFEKNKINIFDIFNNQKISICNCLTVEDLNFTPKDWNKYDDFQKEVYVGAITGWWLKEESSTEQKQMAYLQFKALMNDRKNDVGYNYKLAMLEYYVENNIFMKQFGQNDKVKKIKRYYGFTKDQYEIKIQEILNNIKNNRWLNKYELDEPLKLTSYDRWDKNKQINIV